MSESTPPPGQPPSRGLPDALRDAIESTLSSIGGARDSTAAELEGTLDRSRELLDEVARRGREVQAEIVSRGEDTTDELRRRGADAGAELARLTSHLLEAVRDTLGGGDDEGRDDSEPKPEG